MKLKAFTLIEGIVSMVLLSILLSVAVLISFNLYKSIPRDHMHQMEKKLEMQLDSLIRVEVEDVVNYQMGQYSMQYEMTPSDQFKNMQIATAVISDTLGNEVTKQRLFLKYDK